MELTDRKMIELIRSRDDRGIGTIYSLYHQEFYHFLRKRLKAKEDMVSDIYQDAFMVLCDKIFENKLNEVNLHSSLKTYLFGIGVKMACNLNRKAEYLYRREFKKEIFEIVDEESGLGEENEKIIQSAVQEMGEPCHSILVKQYWEDKSVKEIADEMNYKNEDVAKNQKYRCIQKLKSELKGKIVYQN